LYIVQHGRDDLHRTWPELYSKWQSALLPAEELLRVKEGSDAGWPYYYYDPFQKKKLLNPEYGGDGIKAGNGDKYEQPLIGFPGHWAPNDILFYTGNQFPDHYKNGAFIAFHGSTIRSPYSQAGYFVAFVPFINGELSQEWEVFADGFSGTDVITNTSDAKYRPMGLAQSPDGSLFISDSQKGKIWQIKYRGDKEHFGNKELAKMEKRKHSSHIRNPDEKKDKLKAGKMSEGELIYDTYCVACHSKNGRGDGQRYPPIESSDYVSGDKTRLITILLNGMNETIIIKNKKYNSMMPSHSFLSNRDIALVLTYVRQNFNNKASEVAPGEVKIMRQSLKIDN
jgi:mono/diheme cytochrome c family protein